MNHTNSSAHIRRILTHSPLPVRRRLLVFMAWLPIFALFASVSARAATVTWVGGSGDWGSASNWSSGAVPGQMDDAVIDTSNGAITVTISSETVQVNSVTCEETLLLNGGTIFGGTVTTENGASLVVQSGTLDGVTVNGLLDVGNTFANANLTVTSGLVLNGTALVGSPTNWSNGAISFAGNQVLGGSGTVVFGLNGTQVDANGLLLADSGTTLVIGSGITVRGQNGALGYGPYHGGPQDVSVVNQGTVSADVNGGTIVINAQPLANNGTVAMSNGGSLNINYLPNLVGLSVNGSGTLTLNGNWENNQTISVNGTSLAFNGNWTNSGAISISGGGFALGGNWTNLGPISVSGGPVDLEGNWNNAGTINVNGGTLTVNGDWPSTGVINATNTMVNLGGTFTIASLETFNSVGGAVNLTGTLNNTFTTLLLDGAINSWELQGGVINGGTVMSTNGGVLVIGSLGGTVAGVTVNGVLDVGNTYAGANLTVVDGLVLNGSALVGNPNPASLWFTGRSGGITFSGGQVLSGVGTVVFGANSDSGGNFLTESTSGATLVIGLGITVHGLSGTIGAAGASVINQGTISSDANGGSIVVTAQSVSNAGQMGASNGGILVINNLSDAAGLSSTGGGTLTLEGTWQNSGVLTATSGATLNCGGSWTNAGSMDAVNATVSLSGNWTNGGIIEATGTTLSLSGNWMNAGVLGATNGTLNLGGSLTPATLAQLNLSGTTVWLTGVLNNDGSTLLDGVTASWGLNGGAVLGGTVTTTNGVSFIVQSGTMDGVTFNGVLDVGNTYAGANLTVVDGLVLNGTALVGNPNPASLWFTGRSGGITFSDSQALSGLGTVVFGATPDFGGNFLTESSGATLVIDSGITVHGQSGTIGEAGGSLVNQGTISSDMSGGSLTISSSSFINAGEIVQSGSEAIISVTANTINNGRVEVDNGEVTFSGSFSQYAGSLDFGLSSSSDFGQLNLTGVATVSGTLDVQLESGYLPESGDSFELVKFGASYVVFTNLSLPGGIGWDTKYDGGILTLVAEGILPLGVAISPTIQIVAIGATVSFQATTSGPGPFGYQWLQNGIAIVGATNASLVLSNVAAAATGAYTVQVSNKSGSVLSPTAELTVLGPPAITTGPQSQTVGVGTTVSFPVTVTGTPPLSYQWSFDGQALPGATNATLTLTNVTRAQAGDYSVVVTNIVGSATSEAPAMLSIATGPCPGAPSGMVAWWRGEGNTGDYAGTNDAVFEGVPGFGPGEVGQSFLLDGVTSYLEVPNNPLWSLGTNDFTIEFWANFSSVFSSDMVGDGSTVFIAHDEGSGPRNKWLFGFGGGELYFYLRGPNLPSLFLSQTPFSPITNQWYHLALTKAGSLYQTYVNGAHGSSETNALPVPIADAPLTIGQAQGLYMDGLLDEISLYNRALAPGEIQAIYHAGGQGKCGLESGVPITLQAQVGTGRKVVILVTGGQVGATLTVEASEDLKQWSPVGTLVKSADTDSFSDSTQVLPAARYYRVR